MVIEDYKTMASGATWDNVHIACINDNDPASKAFWEGYTKLPVSYYFYYLPL